MSREDYYQDANYATDSEGRYPPRPQAYSLSFSPSEFLPGDHGGRGTGLTGGQYTRTVAPPGSTSTSPTAKPLTKNEWDDCYAGYDPGMAGCDTAPISCHIPGVPSMGAEHTSLTQPPHPLHTRIRPVSRGYERDGEEYETETENDTPSPSSPPGSTAQPALSTSPGNSGAETQGIGSAGQENQTSGTSANPGTLSAPNAKTSSTKPSIGSRIIGHVERLAGRVLRDPEIEARGKRHVTGSRL